MKRLLILGIGFILCLPVIMAGMERNKPLEIAVVKEMGIQEYDSAAAGFRALLEKENIHALLKIYDRDDRLVVYRIKEMKPDLILTLGATATNLISKEIKDIPIVFSMVLDPRGSDILPTIVGASVDIPVKMQFETLKAAAPSLKSIGVVYNPAENATIIEEARSAANDLGFILKIYPVASEQEIPEIYTLPIDILWIIPDRVVCKQVIILRFLKSGLKNNIGVMGFTRSYANAGALLGISCDYEDIGRQSAEIALKIWQGENYRDLKITLPRKVKLYISKTAADLLGIHIPDAVIKKANEVF
ncbi:MAG: ABC transporter substrate-binding protein [Candidatus Aminicenantes bacterium]|nr:ABC transporter substrate-binding protein [Candidatus Aminicenantes bacterium]